MSNERERRAHGRRMVPVSTKVQYTTNWFLKRVIDSSIESAEYKRIDSLNSHLKLERCCSELELRAFLER
jgi:hypothetical protein